MRQEASHACHVHISVQVFQEKGSTNIAYIEVKNHHYVNTFRVAITGCAVKCQPRALCLQLLRYNQDLIFLLIPTEHHKFIM